MGFSVPNFNLNCNIWHPPATPPGAPSLTEKGNLAWGKRVSSSQGLYTGDSEPVMTLLLPPGTDVRGPQNASGPSAVEVPAGSGRFYTVIGVDDIGKGFPNEHRAASIAWTTAYGTWPAPIP
jgi:hypothetical protein